MNALPDFASARVAIVGLGLMGGSLGLALKANLACREVIGIARRAANLAEARAMGAIDDGTLDMAEGVRHADMVVLSTPVRTILRQIPTLGPLLPPGCCVLDMGSTKTAICRALDALPDGIQPVGGHPMCGKETAGIAGAEPTLYRDKVFVLSPLRRTHPDATRLAESLARAIGSRILTLEPERHDRLVATISHLPYLLACALVRTAEGVGAGDAAVWDVAASGFRDTSRLAASDVTMMLDILLTNREAVLSVVEGAQGELHRLADALREGDEAGLQAALTAAQKRRQALWT